jgi:hypothetical protein
MVTKQEALAAHLSVELADIEEGYNDNTFQHGSREYLVLTAVETYDQSHEQAKDLLWAFTPSHLAQYMGLDVDDAETILKPLQEKCEGAQDAVVALLRDRVDECVSDAIAADGRGHFLSGYDGEEHEAGGYYIYRTN